jgi:large subunit ribosomal protein L10
VQNAITRQKKEEIVKELQGKLEGSVIVFGLRFKNLNVSSLDGSLAPAGAAVAAGRSALSLAAASTWMQLDNG